MQAFRNAAKPLMVVVAFTFFAWLVIDLSGITGTTGLLTKTAVGKVNGQSIDLRTFQTVVQQNIDARQREAPGGLGLEDIAQIRDEVWEQFVQNTVLDAEYKRRGITVSEDEIVESMRNSPPAEFQKIPEFQTDSQFDIGKYQRWLTSSVAQQYLPSLEAQYREQLERVQAAAGRHRRRLPLRRRAVGAVPRRARDGQDRAHRHHLRATSSPTRRCT